MRRSILKKIPLRDDPVARWAPRLHRALLLLFCLQLLLTTIRLFDASFLPGARWPEGLLLVLAAATVISSATQQLPVQNVMLAGFIIAVVGGLAHTVGALTSIPFGPFTYTDEMPMLFPPLPWAMPVIWVLAVLMCRGVGRLILRPWRRTRNYGFWLIGLTAALVVLFDLAFDPFATQVKRYWFWHPTHALVFWQGAPWVNFLGWAATTLVILGFATPSLINKKPVKRPPEYWPLVLWMCLNLFFVVAFVSHHLWLPAVVIVCGTVIMTVFAIKGATW
jgi:uncharacterized membrane protein